jgi:hypothetical protein
MDKLFKNKFLKLGLYALFGGLIGYAYYYYVGCTNGCPLSSNWYITTGYGLVAGIVLALPSKGNKKAELEKDDSSA